MKSLIGTGRVLAGTGINRSTGGAQAFEDGFVRVGPALRIGDVGAWTDGPPGAATHSAARHPPLVRRATSISPSSPSSAYAPLLYG